MAKFKYSSAVTSAFTLNDGKDYALFSGGIYELPQDNAHIMALVDQGYLTPVADEKPKATKQTENK